jgi:hypothetical protein
MFEHSAGRVAEQRGVAQHIAGDRPGAEASAIAHTNFRLALDEADLVFD